jgi:hypothetical protein
MEDDDEMPSSVAECLSQVSPVYASCAGDCSEWRSRGVPVNLEPWNLEP